MAVSIFGGAQPSAFQGRSGPNRIEDDTGPRCTGALVLSGTNPAQRMAAVGGPAVGRCLWRERYGTWRPSERLPLLPPFGHPPGQTTPAVFVRMGHVHSTSM